NISMAPGPHSLVVQSYNGAGPDAGWFKTSENITVSGGSTGCAAPAGTVTICSPPPNTPVNSPVHVVGSSSLSPAATSTLVYLDGVKQLPTSSGPSIDINVNATTGTHYLTVQSYNGAWVKAHEYITVGSGSPPPPPPGSSAV